MRAKAFPLQKQEAGSVCNYPMPPMPIEFSPSALDDLKELLDYFIEQGVVQRPKLTP